MSAEEVAPLLPPWWFQNSAPALRKRRRPTRSRWKLAPSEVTEPVPPSDVSRMSSLYVRPFDTTVPASRTASADVAALRVFDWISAADSFPHPVVPASGSTTAPRQHRPRHDQCAQRAHQCGPAGTALEIAVDR